MTPGRPHRVRASIAALGLGALALGPGACAHGPGRADLAILYTPAARHHAPDRNPIVAIPGILGSRLVDAASGRVVWGGFEPETADPRTPEGLRLLALPVADAALVELHDEVEPDGVLERVRVRLGALALEIQAYAGILATLGAGGYRDEALGLAGQVDYGDDHHTCFQFDYDWRRDNVESARRLHRFLLAKRDQVRAEIHARYGVADAEVRFDIAAHSMGGLVARYFLMYGSQDLPPDGSLPTLTWEGAALAGRVILIGTPNAGSLDALVQLVAGRRMGPLLPFYPPALLGTFPSVYQLLSRGRHGVALWDDDPTRPIPDLLDPELWQRAGWGLTATSQEDVLATLLPDEPDVARRRAIATDFQRRALARAAAFQRALDRAATPPPGLEIFLVAGDSESTLARVSVRGSDGALAVHAHAPGDGTVLRSSALLDERVGGTWQPQLRSPIDFRSVLFLPDGHLALTRNEAFRDNVLYWLLEEPRPPRRRDDGQGRDVR